MDGTLAKKAPYFCRWLVAFVDSVNMLHICIRQTKKEIRLPFLNMFPAFVIL